MTRILSAALALLLSAGTLQAQNAGLTLGGINADSSDPVEVTADTLNVDQETGKAVFETNVVIGQGDMRIAAARVEVTYDDASGDITRLNATGGVTFVTATEEAEAEEADYDLQSGNLVMTGDVLLTQGENAISADRMDVNLDTGRAEMTGNVRTVFQQQQGAE